MIREKIMTRVRELAKDNPRTIVLPEGMSDRTLVASAGILRQRIANLIILGDTEKIIKKSKEDYVRLDGAELIDPRLSPHVEQFAHEYMERRAAKGKPVTEQEAIETMHNPIFFAAKLVEKGVADGGVAGAVSTSGDVERAALRIIGMKKGIRTLSSSFIMILDVPDYGEAGIFIFSDCAVIPNPTSEQLADIAVSAAETGKRLVGFEPRVAMLSFSTLGSAENPSIDKVREAIAIVRTKSPTLDIEGEMQADAAISKHVARKKGSLKNSQVAGRANVLVFPDLNAGNIAYKLVARLANTEAIGPILQGLAKPFNDLSRGATIEEIADVITFTAVQAT